KPRLPFVPPPPSDSGEAIAKSVGDAIVVLMRLGARARDLSGIYCVECDFTHLDLSQTNFSGSILHSSKFSNATLSGANFADANLENTQFIAADLQDAILTGKAHSYISNIFNTHNTHEGNQRIFINQSFISGPIFDCADLRRANFSGHSIFGFVSEKARSQDKSPPLLLFSASFVGVNLEGTNFGEAQMFGVKSVDEDFPFPSYGFNSIITHGFYNLFQSGISKSNFDETGRKEAGDLSGYNKSLYLKVARKWC